MENRDFIQKGWEIRKNFNDIIWFAVPGAKKYLSRYYTNRPGSFVNLSVTGKQCSCQCAHCGGNLLRDMIPVTTPDQMNQVMSKLVARQCRGILVSGGCNTKGEVPLLPFVDSLRYAKKLGLKVLVHGGLIQADTAAGLKEAGVDQVLLDIIGDRNTINRVYHLDNKPDDYWQAMQNCHEAGLKIAPHIVIGLDFGEIRGEIRALEMIKEVGPEKLVLVVLTPTANTDMENFNPPLLSEVAHILSIARILNPKTPLSLGCARPAGKYKRKIEKIAVDCGFNSIAYPDDNTIEHALSQGLTTKFVEECCSLISC